MFVPLRPYTLWETRAILLSRLMFKDFNIGDDIYIGDTQVRYEYTKRVLVLYVNVQSSMPHISSV